MNTIWKSALRVLFLICVTLSLWILSRELLSTGQSSIGGGDVVIDAPDYRSPAVLLSEANGPRRTVSHRFSVQNHSSSLKSIVVRRISCGCAGLFDPGTNRPMKTGDSFTLAPGQSKPLELEMSLRAGLAKTYVESVTLASQTEEADYEVSIRVTAPVIADVAVEPSALSHDFRQPVDQVEKILSVRRHTRSEASPKSSPSLVSLPDGVSVRRLTSMELTQVESGLWRQQWEVVLAVAPPERLKGRLSSQFFVQFSDDVPDSVTVPVNLQWTEGIMTAPSEIDFGVVKVGQTAVKKCLLASNEGRDFRILSTTSSLQSLTIKRVPLIKTDPSGAASKHWIEFQLYPTEEGDLTGEITIQTDHPTSPEVKLEVRVLCR